MHKKNDEIVVFKLFVIIIFNATKDPNKYDPLSPRNILAFGKLKSKNEIKIIICDVKKNENSIWLLSKFIKSKMELITIRLIVRRPLKPSIKFAPLIINKKLNNTKKIEKILFSNQEFKKNKSTFLISIGSRLIKSIKKITISVNLVFGLVLILISSKKPILTN